VQPKAFAILQKIPLKCILWLIYFTKLYVSLMISFSVGIIFVTIVRMWLVPELTACSFLKYYRTTS
jgi:hypothetical protein